MAQQVQSEIRYLTPPSVDVKKKGGLIMAQQVQSEIRYLTPPSVDVKKKKYCRFKKSGIKYIDYKDPEFLKKFLNEQGKILPRRITGTSLKYQRRISVVWLKLLREPVTWHCCLM